MLPVSSQAVGNKSRGLTSAGYSCHMIAWIHGHKHVKYGKKRWNNKDIFIEKKYANRKLKKCV
jgi:hypothetical protein